MLHIEPVHRFLEQQQKGEAGQSFGCLVLRLRLGVWLRPPRMYRHRAARRILDQTRNIKARGACTAEDLAEVGWADANLFSEVSVPHVGEEIPEFVHTADISYLLNSLQAQTSLLANRQLSPISAMAKPWN